MALIERLRVMGWRAGAVPDVASSRREIHPVPTAQDRRVAQPTDPFPPTQRPLIPRIARRGMRRCWLSRSLKPSRSRPAKYAPSGRRPVREVNGLCPAGGREAAATEPPLPSRPRRHHHPRHPTPHARLLAGRDRHAEPDPTRRPATRSRVRTLSRGPRGRGDRRERPRSARPRRPRHRLPRWHPGAPVFGRPRLGPRRADRVATRPWGVLPTPRRCIPSPRTALLGRRAHSGPDRQTTARKRLPLAARLICSERRSQLTNDVGISSGSNVAGDNCRTQYCG